ncbi:MAG TPA: hypothetical protein VFS56_08240, partial [Gemmatimonadaceae bacterium]|nr:hypothetical protein [Gemmatimonadaceae bacterium]
MTGIMSLWLPILLSSVIVFLVSAVIHMAPLWHKNDYPRVPNEDQLINALRPLAIPPGDYLVPRASGPAEMKSPEFEEKMRAGPNMILTVLPNGPWTMGRNLGLWFAYVVVVGIFTAYVSGRAVPPGSPYLEVFRFAGVAAFLAYSVGLWQMSIWFRRSWSLTIWATIDGLIFALLTAGVFGW